MRFQRSVFTFATVVVALWLPVAPALAVQIEDWTFETTVPTTAGPFAPDAGISPNITNSAASSTTPGGTTVGVLSSPAGNGSSHSYSSNGWDVGDYWQFKADTTGFTGITLSFDMTSSGTGPRDFIFQYSSDGTTFTPFGSGITVLPNAAPNPTWNATSSSPIYTTTLNLSSISGLSNISAAYFRLIDNSTTSASGGTVGTAGTSRIDNFIVNGNVIPPPSPSLYFAGNGTAIGTSGTWGNTTPAHWFTSNPPTAAAVNWDSTQTAIFTGSSTASPTTVMVDGGGVTVSPTTTNANSLQFDSSGYTLTGGAITLSAASPIIAVTNASDSATIASPLQLSSTLVKGGAGTLILTANNTYGSTTEVLGGTLQLGGGATTGSVSTDVQIDGGSTLAFKHSNDITYGGNVTNNGGTLVQAGSGAVTLSGTIGGTAATFGQTGTGIFKVTGTLSATSTQISSGTVQIGDGVTAGAGSITMPVNVSAGATLQFNRPDENDLGGRINGPGNVVVAGTGLVNFAQPTGSSTPINLTINPGATAGISNTFFGPIVDNGALIYNRGATNITQSDPITGTGTLEKQGTSTMTVTAAYSYTGATTITDGILQLGNGTTSGSISNNIVINSSVAGALALNPGATPATLPGNISGPGSVAHVGTGSATLSGNNSYLGGTTISGNGSLKAASNTALGAGPVTVTAGTLLVGTGTTITNPITVGTNSTKFAVADWTFETSQPLTAGPFAAEAGSNAANSLATGSHSDGATAYSTPAGNGSAHSFSSNTWNTGDYYQFTTSTIGQKSITFSVDQTSSTTGPGQFKLQISTDGTNFTDLVASYNVQPNAATGDTPPGPGTWSATGTRIVADINTIDLDAAYAEQPLVYVRLVDIATTSSTGGALAAGGTSRVDNVIISALPDVASSLGSDITSGTATYQGNVTINSGLNLTSAAGGTVVFSGNLDDGGAGLPVVKTGAGNVVLSHANTYAGPTTVQQGTLTLGVANAIQHTSSITLSGGTLATNGLAQDFSSGASPVALKVTATSTLDLGNASTPTNVKFSDSATGNTWTGTLNILNWTFGTDHLFLGGTSAGGGSVLSALQLGAIHFADFSTGASVLSTGEITPLVGDINQQNGVGVADVQALMSALSNQAAYAAAHPSLTATDIKFLLDVNHDGFINNKDVQAEISLVATSGGQAGFSVVPEPSTMLLGLLGAALGFGLIKRRK